MSSFAKGFIALLLSICVAMSAVGCAPSEQNSSLIGSIYKNGKYDFRGIAQHSTLNALLEMEGLTENDVSYVPESGLYYRRNELYQLSDISSPCIVLYVFIDENCDDFLGGRYIFQPQTDEEFQSISAELFSLLKSLPEPAIGKAEPLRDGKTGVMVTWEGKDRTRLVVTTGLYNNGSTFIDLAITTLYAVPPVENFDAVID